MQFQQDDWVFERRQIESLESILIRPRKSTPTKLVTLCHGFGAPGTDLVGLFDDILGQLPDSTLLPAFLFPQGAIDLQDEGLPDARAWWRINMARLMQMAATHSFEAIRNDIPEGIDDAREMLCRTIQACVALNGWQGCSHIVGGFSQGAMLAVDTFFRGSIQNIEGLVICSGALICEQSWRQAGLSRAACERPMEVRIVQTHGTMDSVLPIETGRWLHEMLNDLNLNVLYDEFTGPHTIPGIAIERIASLLQ